MLQGRKLQGVLAGKCGCTDPWIQHLDLTSIEAAVVAQQIISSASEIGATVSVTSLPQVNVRSSRKQRVHTVNGFHGVHHVVLWQCIL